MVYSEKVLFKTEEEKESFNKDLGEIRTQMINAKAAEEAPVEEPPEEPPIEEP